MIYDTNVTLSLPEINIILSALKIQIDFHATEAARLKQCNMVANHRYRESEYRRMYEKMVAATRVWSK